MTRPNAVFCGECGASLSGVSEAPVVAPVAVAAAVQPVVAASNPGLIPPPMPPSVAAAKASTSRATETPALLRPPPPPPPTTIAPPPPPPPPPLVVPELLSAPSNTNPDSTPDVTPPAILISAVPSFDQEATTTPPRSPSGFDRPVAVAAEVTPAPAVESEPESDRTQLSTRRRAARWRLVLPDGRAIAVSQTTLIGRNPGATPRFPGAKLEKVEDPAKSVSKTHAVLQSDAEGLWITDLGSTNGVILTQPDGSEIDLAAEARTLVLAGADIDLGDFVMRVETD